MQPLTKSAAGGQATAASAGRSASSGGASSVSSGSAGPVPWKLLYRRQPHAVRSLFELEAMVAKRMELLAWIDTLVNSPAIKNTTEVLDKIKSRILSERKLRLNNSGSKPSYGGGGVILGGEANDDEEITTASASASTNAAQGVMVVAAKAATATSGGGGGASAQLDASFQDDEDLISHLLCRFAFCVSDKWRKWFLRMEELLFRARVDASDVGLILKTNSIDCLPLTYADNTEKFQKYVKYRKARGGALQGEAGGSIDGYFSAPLSLASKLVKDRAVLCVRGRAVVSKQEALEVLLASFRGILSRGLHDCFLARTKLLSGGAEDGESSLAHVSMMLDAFLQKFVAEPTDRATVATEGSVRHTDVQLLASTHFPLCMRKIDRHLRSEGHLRHTGRFAYGLFLKQIGLTKDDALVLFSTLMTVKGGGSVEAFSKGEYGYNVRHNYGLEGKKTSYSGMSCATMISQPPSVDRHDCHGCPFRFRDETAFRALLAEPFPSPLVAEAPKQRLLGSEIEDIVKDAREMHYTRACFRFFTAVHPNAKRDTLFRSPAEYYDVSRDVKKQYELAEGKKTGPAEGEGAVDSPSARRFTGQSTKRTLLTTDPVEGVVKPRLEE